jgi:RNAse (barnase) inhibitor barstar
MAVFREEDFQRLDLGLLKNGAVHLYYRPAVLAEDVAWLEDHQYRIDNFDCSKWKTVEAMHEELAGRLEFPDYYGRNLDALNDCMSDIAIPEDGGRVLVFHRYDDFTARLPDVAWHILDIINGRAWLHALFGRKLMALVQSNDPRIKFPPFSSHSAMWNPREWLDKSRGL